jgi:hypothetical protein
MGEFFERFFVRILVGMCSTLFIADKFLAERSMHKLAEATRKRLLEERSRQRLEAEWSNMTTAGNNRAVFNPTTGRWLVFDK